MTDQRAEPLRHHEGPAKTTRARDARRLKILELHVTHACNLTCESCSHYSNHGHRGILTLAEADRWMGYWSERVGVERLGLLGGEPTINPELPEFVTLARRHWPEARIRITTNGFFLHRLPRLPAALAAAGNAHILLSLHHGSPEYSERTQPVRALLESWQREFGIAVEHLSSYKNWTLRYRGFGDGMLPFDDREPRKSWEICPARSCKQLFEGKLWKCAPLAYLKLQKQKYRLSSEWDSYLRYEALEPGCSDAALDAFIEIEDEPSCAMCPATPRRFDLPMPLRNQGSLPALQT